MTAPPGTPVVPYPGLASFQDRPEDRLLFFGREHESAALLNLVLSAPLTLLFSRSGLGKSSLINAGLLEELRTREFFPVVVRLTHDAARGPLASVYECVARHADKTHVTIDGTRNEHSLWEYFAGAKFVKSNATLRPTLILDQFEELFTVIQRTPEWATRFVSELADLVRQRVPEDLRAAALGRLEAMSPKDEERKQLVSLLYEGVAPDVRVLISMREDFLSELQGLRPQIPDIFRNSLRLDPLTVEQARRAIELPGQQTAVLGDDTFTFGAGVLEAMLASLRMQKIAGKMVQGDTVEPVQLQILCQHLNRRRQAHSAREITMGDFKAQGGVKRVLGSYYKTVLRKVPIIRLGWSARRFRPSLSNLLVVHRARAAVRRLCERGLITGSGHRNSLIVDEIRRQFGVSDRDLAHLINDRLLRVEPRLNSYFYELSHDTLIAPLRGMRLTRRVWSAVGIAGVVLLPFLVVGVMTSVEKGREFRKRAPLLEALRDTTVPASQRAASLSNLSGMGYKTFSGLNLRGLQLAGSYLAGATLDRADLASGDLRGIVLRYGNLVGANLTSATATSADFGYARLSRAILVGANLSGANLGGASLDSADLTRASLDGANFSGARIDGAQFSETAWWLAVGWTADQRRLLTRWPPASYATTGTYRAQLGRLDRQVDAAETGADSAAALNERSWYRAVHGAELQQATADAKRSLELLPGDIHTLDTRGYVFLQLGQRYAALADFQRSVTREPDFSRDHAPGERLYHWGLALERVGAGKVADSVFRKSDSLGYCPTYEQVLTPRPGADTLPSSCSPRRQSRRPAADEGGVAPLPLRRP